MRPPDVVWLIDGPDGLHIESYTHHKNGALASWTTLREGEAIERRFR